MPSFLSLHRWLLSASPPRDIVLAVLAGLAGWGVSHHYYVRALNDMKADADERRRVENLVFLGIESIGDIRYARDPSGKVVGVTIELHASASGESGGTARLSGTQVQETEK